MKKKLANKTILKATIIGIVDLILLSIMVFLSIGFFSKDKGLKEFNFSYDLIIPIKYEVIEKNNERFIKTKTIKYRRIDLDNLSIGQFVIFEQNCHDDTYLFVAKLTKVEEDIIEIVPIPDIDTNCISIENIKYEYIKEANIFGKIYYTLTKSYNIIFVYLFNVASLLMTGFFIKREYDKQRKNQEIV